MIEQLLRLALQGAQVKLLLAGMTNFWGPYKVKAVGRGEPPVLILEGTQADYLVNVDQVVIVQELP